MIDTPGRSGHLTSGDHVTHYLEWGDPSNARVMLLLHGFRGHAHWWDFVAPWFAAEYRVIAIDFGGMGDSSFGSSTAVAILSRKCMQRCR